MAREKQKEEKPKRIVEVGAELVENEAPSTVPKAISPEVSSNEGAVSVNHTSLEPGETSDLNADAVQVSKSVFDSVSRSPAPSTALKTTIMRALPFVLVSLLLFALPFFFTGETAFWLKYSQVRTYMLGALIWNLIGACLYAQVDKRSHKIILLIIFALPLITSHHWASFAYMVEMSLRSILNTPL